jgi:hypothetical protein
MRHPACVANKGPFRLVFQGDTALSRAEAMRWKLVIEKYIRDCGYKIGTLVAFSGEVNDPEVGMVGGDSKILNFFDCQRILSLNSFKPHHLYKL